MPLEEALSLALRPGDGAAGSASAPPRLFDGEIACSGGFARGELLTAEPADQHERLVGDREDDGWSGVVFLLCVWEGLCWVGGRESVSNRGERKGSMLMYGCGVQSCCGWEGGWECQSEDGRRHDRTVGESKTRER